VPLQPLAPPSAHKTKPTLVIIHFYAHPVLGVEDYSILLPLSRWLELVTLLSRVRTKEETQIQISASSTSPQPI
jgi:hypothetical protein